MTKANKFSPEVRERAVRMVLEHRGQYPSQDRCITSFANFQYALVQKSTGSSSFRVELDSENPS